MKDWVMNLIITIWIISLFIVASGTQAYERKSICVGRGYSSYSSWQDCCIQEESEGVRVYIDYPLVLEGIENG